MMTGLNIGHGLEVENSSHKILPNSIINGASMLGNAGNTVTQVAKGQRVMNALQKMY